MPRYTDRRKQEIAVRNKTWLLNPELHKKKPVPVAEKKTVIRIPIFCPDDKATIYVRLENMHKYMRYFRTEVEFQAYIDKHLGWLEGSKDGLLGTYSVEKYKKIFSK